MTAKSGVGLGRLAAAALLLAVFSGCVSPGVKNADSAFMQTLRATGKVTIANYEDIHAADVAPKLGVLPTLLVDPDAFNSEAIQRKLNYRAGLNEKCISAIEKILLAGKDFPYVARASLGLSGPGPDKSGMAAYYTGLKGTNKVTALIKVQFIFGAEMGWKKHLIMYVKWEILSPDGQIRAKVLTSAASAKAEEIFPDSLSPRNEFTFVELADRNATQFLELIRKQNIEQPL